MLSMVKVLNYVGYYWLNDITNKNLLSFKNRRQLRHPIYTSMVLYFGLLLHWQIEIHLNNHENTAFTTEQGLW